jgi:mono/diheme cytochrome c family protein
MDIGGITLSLAVLGFIGWLTFLVNQSRVRRRRETTPHNQAEFLDDTALETKRLSRVLVAALISSAVLAIVMPVYYLNETSRQEAAAETFHEIAVERGHHWYEEFGCGDCHGATGAGGGAAFIEARSGVETSWAAPAINDVLYRYSEEETLYWLTYGRQGSPMPAWGIEGGGPMNEQQLDELIAYLEYIQISQAEAVEQVDGKVARELSRLSGAADSAAGVEADIMADIAAIGAAPRPYEEIKDLPEALASLLSSDGTCTAETASAVGEPCDSEGPDTDRDGISDAAEVALGQLIDDMLTWTPPTSNSRPELEGLAFDPQNAFTTAAGTTAIPDLDQIEDVVGAFESVVRDVRLTLDSREALFSIALTGLEFVQAAADAEAWTIDFEQIAAAEFDGNIADAQRGAALYNAYCARCHTAGYSAGVTFTQEAGSGGFGPSLRNGRSVVQFPDEAEHLSFIINGSVNGQLYGVNGIGRGWMPGFGTVLSEQDLMLIVKFERALR